jgi:hypothetical protein
MNKYLILTVLPFTSTLMAEEIIYENLDSLVTALNLKAQSVIKPQEICAANTPVLSKPRTHSKKNPMTPWIPVTTFPSYGPGTSTITIANSDYKAVTQQVLRDKQIVETIPNPGYLTTGLITSESTVQTTISKGTNTWTSEGLTTSISNSFGLQSSYGVDSTYLAATYETVKASSTTSATGGGVDSSLTWSLTSSETKGNGDYRLDFYVNKYSLVGPQQIVVTYDIKELNFTTECKWETTLRGLGNIPNTNTHPSITIIPSGHNGARGANGELSVHSAYTLGMASNSFKVKTDVYYNVHYQDPWPVYVRVPPMPVGDE